MRTYDDVHELIKRLRNNKVTLGHGEYGVDPLCELAAKELDEAANEIERLRTGNDDMRATLDQQIKEVGNLGAEIERLRAALWDIHAVCNNGPFVWAKRVKTIARAGLEGK